MQVRYQVGNVQVEVEGKDVKDAFAQLATAVEVFGQQHCGACSSEAVVPVVRTKDGNTYYEMRCKECGATLAFGQKREGGALFPRRRDKDNEYLPNYGWVKYSRQQSDDGTPF
jgi:hypothetical protein